MFIFNRCLYLFTLIFLFLASKVAISNPCGSNTIVQKPEQITNQVASVNNHEKRSVKNKLNGIKSNFTINDKPIHPLIIKNFTVNSIAYDNNVIHSINLDDSKYNKSDYPYTIQTNKNNKIIVSIDNKQWDEYKGYHHFSYQYLGTTNNNTLVVLTKINTGGTGVFTSLLFLNAKEVKEYGNTDFELTNNEINNKVLHSKSKIILEKLGEVYLGDRVNPKIETVNKGVIINGKKLMLKKQS